MKLDNRIDQLQKEKLSQVDFEKTKDEFRHNHAYVVYSEMKALVEKKFA